MRNNDTMPPVAASGEVVTLNTDGYSSFTFFSLTIDEGGLLTAVGASPLVINAWGCTIAGSLDVSVFVLLLLITTLALALALALAPRSRSCALALLRSCSCSCSCFYSYVCHRRSPAEWVVRARSG
jgi:hypothetical protein